MDLIDRPRASRREVVFAGLLLVAGALVTTGLWLASVTAGLVSGGLCLALWSFLVLVDVP